MRSNTLRGVLGLWTAVVILLHSVSAHQNYVVHEKRDSLPCGWSQGDRVHRSAAQHVRIALTQTNLDVGHNRVMEVSDPDSPLYGQYWTPEQVRDFFSPTEDTVRAVREWLESSIPSSSIKLSEDKGWLEFHTYTSRLEDLLGTKFYQYQHEKSGSVVHAAEVYYVPASIQPYIDMIYPGVLLKHPGSNENGDRGLTRRRVEKRSGRFSGKVPTAHNGKAKFPASIDEFEASTCENLAALEPECIRALYGIPDTLPPKVAGYQHGIYMSGGDHYSQENLDTFFASYAPAVPKGHGPQVFLANGAQNPLTTSNVGGELQVDLAVTIPHLYPNDVFVYNMDDPVWQTDANVLGSYNILLSAFDANYCSNKAYNTSGDNPAFDPTYPDPKSGGYTGTKQCGGLIPPQVLASAWEATEDYYPISYQRRQCDEFKKMAMQGMTVLASTGDFGIAGVGAPTCYGANKDQWTVAALGNCPYVTAVGGTQLASDANIRNPTKNPEEGWYAGQETGSGGGISTIFGRPDWQTAAVTSYLERATVAAPAFSALAPLTGGNTTLPDIISTLNGNGKGVRNTLGRGTPDISALGATITDFIIDDGVVYQCGGTSTSAQLVAVIISRINLERMSKGKSPVGFINPVLYKYADTIVRDITEGHTNDACGTTGYPVTTGWDAVTGLGVLKYQEALKLWLSL